MEIVLTLYYLQLTKAFEIRVGSLISVNFLLSSTPIHLTVARLSGEVLR